MKILSAWAATLKFKIIALAVATAALAAAGAGSLVLGSLQQQMTDMLLANAAEEREQTAALLTSKVQTLQGALQAVARHVPPQGWQQPDSLADYLLDKPALAAMFDSVFLAGLDGSILARVKNGQTNVDRPNIADREYFRRALASDQPVISRPIQGKVLKAPIVVFAVPVLGPDGRAIGVLGGSTELRSTALFAEVHASRQASQAGQAGQYGKSSDLVMDRTGLLLTHPDPARIMGRAADEPGLNRWVNEWLGSGSPIDTEARATLEVNGQYLVSSAGIPFTDWVLVHATPSQQALSLLSAARTTAHKAALAAGAVAGLLAGALAFALTRPITRLQARAHALLNPVAPSEHWPEERGEVGDLARAFQSVVQQREQRQAEVQALVTQLEAIVDHAEVGIALTRHSCFELVSHQFCHMFRCSKADVVGQATRTIYSSEEAYQALAARARPAFMESGAFDGELQLMRRSGQEFWARMRGRAVVPGDMSQGTIWTIEDITASREHREKLTWSASHDALTGLANRAAFEDQLDHAINAIDVKPLIVLFIDLDHFKQVNDRGGHAAGDALLRGLAGVLKAQVRGSDLVARLGGDEFAVLLPACPPEHGQAVAHKLCHAVAAYRLDWDDAQFAVGASVGMTVVTSARHSAAEVLRAADAACYVAKRHGRSRVEQQAVTVPGELLELAG